MRRTLDAAGLRVPGGLRAIEVGDRTTAGRARTLRLRGSKKVIVPASQLRFQIGRTIGWDRIKSDLYDVRREGDLFLFHGYGAGHGVGLCQAGADRMGESGRDYRDILAHYYPGTTVGLTAGGLTWRGPRRGGGGLPASPAPGGGAPGGAPPPPGAGSRGAGRL